MGIDTVGRMIRLQASLDRVREPPDFAAAQPIQVDDAGNTGWLTAIDFVDEQFKLAATTREGGDVIIGDNDVSARVDGTDPTMTVGAEERLAAGLASMAAKLIAAGGNIIWQRHWLQHVHKISA